MVITRNASNYTRLYILSASVGFGIDTLGTYVCNNIMKLNNLVEHANPTNLLFKCFFLY